MSTSAAPSPAEKPADLGSARPVPEPLTPPANAEGLDLEEDVAPNLGGEDQMQDA